LDRLRDGRKLDFQTSHFSFKQSDGGGHYLLDVTKVSVIGSHHYLRRSVPAAFVPPSFTPTQRACRHLSGSRDPGLSDGKMNMLLRLGDVPKQPEIRRASRQGCPVRGIIRNAGNLGWRVASAPDVEVRGQRIHSSYGIVGEPFAAEISIPCLVAPPFREILAASPALPPSLVENPPLHRDSPRSRGGSGRRSTP
jgi:hypothetical protein